MSKNEIQKFVNLVNGSGIGYNLEAKAEFKRLSMKVLRQIVLKLGLPKGSFEICFNTGGIAVSGDPILHSEHLYIDMSLSCLGPQQGFMFRSCKGRKDYTGGQNHWMKWEELLDLDRAVARISHVVPAGGIHVFSC